jgi:hypothetical protein
VSFSPVHVVLRLPPQTDVPSAADRSRALRIADLADARRVTAPDLVCFGRVVFCRAWSGPKSSHPDRRREVTTPPPLEIGAAQPVPLLEARTRS